ncbi:MAG: HlyD family secretion protein [Bacteroidota bacterium]|nr:HlyD family secretion protein [Bacteroidota bacterium]
MKKKRGVKFYLPLILVVVAVFIGVYLWYREYARFISTDDAYIEADKVSVSSRITARIMKLYADEGDSVKSGELMAELDSADLISQRNQVLSQLALSKSAVNQAQSRYDYDREAINVQKVNEEKATEDFNRAKLQFEGNVITKEQYDHLQKALETAKALVKSAEAQIGVSKAQVANSLAAVDATQSQIGVIETQLEHTRIYAPFSGIIAKRWLLPGDMAQTGQAIMTITETHHLWVSAYLEETKLHGVYLGQPVRFTVDAFPGVKFTGKIYQIGSNTAAQFSLIPPNNASGNFTKVTQRVPLKISIDSDSGDKKEKVRLVAGMSAVIHIIRK